MNITIWVKTFVGQPLGNLDLYLMPAEATDTNQSVWSSVSAERQHRAYLYSYPSRRALQAQSGEKRMRLALNLSSMP